MLCREIVFRCSISASVLLLSTAFTSVPIRNHEFTLTVESRVSRSRCGVSSLPLQDSTSIGLLDIGGGGDAKTAISQQIAELAKSGDICSALEFLTNSTATNYEDFSSTGLYQTVLAALATFQKLEATTQADKLFKTIVDGGYHPTGEVVNAIVAIWAKSGRENSAERCIQYIRSLWSKHDQTGDEQFVPMRSSYVSAITALSRGRSRIGRENAEQAEALLEEMEKRRASHPRLSPNTVTVNAVLNAWSKSRLVQGAARRSEQILERMIYLGKYRPELRPDTTSFNTVLDTLAKSLESDRELRAEALLEKMEAFSESDPSLNCRPNEVSFNIVINCWAQSRQRGSARRATAILQHMSKRYESGISDVTPDAASYTTTINAWARSREIDAVQRAEEVLQWCEECFKLGNARARPNTLTYNSMINCYSKSRVGASDKALAMFESMKERSQAGAEWCAPDVVTYTSMIDSLAKEQTPEATEMSEKLLQELEIANSESSNSERLKPNVRTYTSAINAIGRSGKTPEKAEAILERLEKLADGGNKAVAPDVVCYNAVLNAYGWSQAHGKASKCFSILQRMIARSESGLNYLAKPDIITCNSVLNACAFEKAKTEAEKGVILKVVVDTLEIFQKASPRYGYPDHVTYSQVLYAISNQMEAGEEQYALAEATFWQCCQAGQVNAKVVNALERALSWPRFAALMGSSLKSRDGEKASFDLSLFPRTWTRHALKRNKVGSNSKSSRKRDRGYKITHQGLKKLSGKSQ